MLELGHIKTINKRQWQFEIAHRDGIVGLIQVSTRMLHLQTAAREELNSHFIVFKYAFIRNYVGAFRTLPQLIVRLHPPNFESGRIAFTSPRLGARGAHRDE